MTTYSGKSCSFGLMRVPFVNCRQFMYLVISLLVLRAGCGIYLYQFLIIAYHFTLLVYDECKLRYGQFTMYTEIYCRNSIVYYWLPCKWYNFSSPNDFFFLRIFFAFNGSL